VGARATARRTGRVLNRRAILAAGGGLVAAACSGGMRSAAAQPSIFYGPVDGQLVHPPAGVVLPGTVRYVVALSEADYVIRTTFHNPYAAINSGVFNPTFTVPTAYRQWSYGFDFRLSPSRGGAVYVDSLTYHWAVVIFTPDAAVFKGRRPLRTLQGGVPGLRIGEGETNDLQLVVSGPIGQLTVNGEDIAALNLSDLLQRGDVAVATGYTSSGVFGLAPGATGYEGFTITPALPPTPFGQRAPSYLYGPVNGGIRQTKQGSNMNSTSQSGEGFITGARMRDGIINARFYNPYDAAEQPWDYGFWFRSNSTPTSGPSGYYTLAIRSDGTYVLAFARAVSRAYIAREVQRGPVALQTGAGEGNDVEVRVDGPGGMLSVNGYEIATLDLHDLTDEGDVFVLTAMSVPPQRGTVTRYENLTVAALPPP